MKVIYNNIILSKDIKHQFIGFGIVRKGAKFMRWIITMKHSFKANGRDVMDIFYFGMESST